MSININKNININPKINTSNNELKHFAYNAKNKIDIAVANASSQAYNDTSEYSSLASASMNSLVSLKYLTYSDKTNNSNIIENLTNDPSINEKVKKLYKDNTSKQYAEDSNAINKIIELDIPKNKSIYCDKSGNLNYTKIFQNIGMPLYSCSPAQAIGVFKELNKEKLIDTNTYNEASIAFNSVAKDTDALLTAKGLEGVSANDIRINIKNSLASNLNKDDKSMSSSTKKSIIDTYNILFTNTNK
ncbi:MAG: hypothetical protein PUE01_02000 [Clostridiaceae bacterium]|nr:hypothetical protein [Clostridiaceae bacterium]